MFDKKGQSALEYLMTYGWALIVIVIVIGVLIYLLSGQTGANTCTVSGTELVYQDSAVPANGTTLTVKLQNATGRNVTALDGSLGTGSLLGTVATTYTPAVPIVSGTTFDVVVTPTTALSGSYRGTFDLTYTATGGIANKITTVTCSGTA